MPGQRPNRYQQKNGSYVSQKFDILQNWSPLKIGTPNLASLHSNLFETLNRRFWGEVIVGSWKISVNLSFKSFFDSVYILIFPRMQQIPWNSATFENLTYVTTKLFCIVILTLRRPQILQFLHSFLRKG